MTIVAIWLEQDALWSVADTRFSHQTDDGVIRSTDSGAKLFTLPVVCWKPQENGHFAPFAWLSLGYAFAGHVTAGTQTYLTASAMLQSLKAIKPNALPSIEDIARMVAEIARKYSMDIMQSTQCTEGGFDFCVFGFDVVRNSYRAYAGSNKFDKKVISFFQEVGLEQPFSFGSGKQAFEDTLAQIANSGDPHGRRARLPKVALDEMIRKQTRQDVGGAMAIGITDRFGFRIVATVAPRVIGEPEPIMTINGMDVSEMLAVGEYVVMPDGML
jgi:hypothetical protein